MSMKEVFLKFKQEKGEFIYLLLCLGVYLIITSLLGITCLIKHTIGISCPGCGMTRAIRSLAVFNFSKAFYYHPLVFLLIPMMVLLVFFTIRKMYKTRKIFIYAMVFIFVAVYFYRLVFTETAVVVLEPSKGLIIKFLRWLF